MAQSIRDIVCSINNSLEKIFKGAKFYGVATSVDREGKAQPVVNGQSVTFDDSFAMQTYYKINSIGISYKPGMGRTNNTINTFNMSAIVFNNEQRTKLKTDEIAMIFQSYLTLLNISSVRIIPTGAILNTAGIFSIEYRGNDFRLSESHSLMQFNFSVEMTFKSGCFDLCPEDFSSCIN